MEIALVIGLLILAIVLFSLDKVSVDVIAISLVLVLIFSGIITPQEAFKGFSSEFMVVLASIFVISGALTETGVLDTMGARLVKLIGGNRHLLLVYVMLITSLLSAFMNNTTVTALVVGPVMAMCRKMKIPPSKVLMAVSFASILGGTCTLIGTSTNLAVSGYIQNQGLTPLSFFEITHVGIVLAVCGILYCILFSKWIFPERKTESFTEGYEMRQYLTEIMVTPASKLIGQRVFESDLAKGEIVVVKVIRGNENFIPNRSTQIQAEDILLVECKLDKLVGVKETAGIEILADVITDQVLQSNKVNLAEVLVTRNSRLIDRSLKESNFRMVYDLVVLALHRKDENLHTKIGSIKLKTGDLLLLQGTPENIDAARNSNDFMVLGDFRVNMFKEKKGILTASFFILAVILGSFEIIPLSAGFLCAALLSVFAGAVTADRVYRLIDWRLLVLIGGMSAFGIAMENSGASAFLAQKIIDVFGSMGSTYVLGAFLLLVVFLTQPMSNAAAALVVLPVAMQAAEFLHADPRTFAIAVMLGASVSFVTPFEPSCILVYGPGKYKFTDFVKAGLPLTLILIVIILWLVPV